MPQVDGHLRQAGLIAVDIHSTPDTGQQLADLGGFLVQQVEVVAEDVDDELGRGAGDGLLHAFGQERHDFEGQTGEFGQRGADFRLRHLRLLTLKRLQVHVQFAVVRAEGVLAVFRPTGFLRYRADVRVLQEFGGNEFAQADGFLE